MVYDCSGGGSNFAFRQTFLNIGGTAGALELHCDAIAQRDKRALPYNSHPRQVLGREGAEINRYTLIPLDDRVAKDAYDGSSLVEGQANLLARAMIEKYPWVAQIKGVKGRPLTRLGRILMKANSKSQEERGQFANYASQLSELFEDWHQSADSIYVRIMRGEINQVSIYHQIKTYSKPNDKVNKVSKRKSRHK